MNKTFEIGIVLHLFLQYSFDTFDLVVTKNPRTKCNMYVSTKIKNIANESIFGVDPKIYRS